MSIHERIAQIQRELEPGDALPADIRMAELTLSALLGNIGIERRAADAAYRAVLATALQQHEKANRARVVAENTPEYQRLAEAKGVEHAVEQLIITCRGYLRSLSEELRLQR